MVEASATETGPPRTLEEAQAALRALRPWLERDYGVISVWISGSFARGEQDDRSDLDLLVEFDPDRDPSLFGFVGLQLELSDRLGIRVDLGEPRGIKPRLRDRILREAILL